MKIAKTKLCYYPTKIILVDDDVDFSAGLEHQVAEMFPVQTFELPEDALKYINSSQQSQLAAQCMQNNPDASPDYIDLRFNIRKLHEGVLDNDRFNEVSVVVVDYAMPKINGLQLSRELKQSCPQIKIVMLTGEADEKLAVEAFNRGDIDKFLLKDNEGLEIALMKALYEMQDEFFKGISDTLVKDVKGSKDHLQFMTDPIFNENFKKICLENEVVEYYLVDNQGSFMLVNASGSISWFACVTEEEMDSLVEFSVLGNASSKVITSLRERKSIVFLPTEEDQNVAPCDWEKYSHPATKLNGKQTYYYSYVNGRSNELNGKKIQSYQDFLNAN